MAIPTQAPTQAPTQSISGQSSPSIHVLGQFRLCSGKGADDVVNVESRQLGRRACELLQLLSLPPRRSLPHEQVLEALWPHLDPKAGSANLRKAAHHARHFIGEADALVLRGGRVFLFPDRNVHCDAVAFEQAADEALAAGDVVACTAAAGMYGGDLLPDAPYEPWTEAPRRRLREKFLLLLRKAGLFERLLQEEPADEPAHLALMRAELAADRRSAALRWYVHLRDHLQQSLGVKPGPDAEALYRECVAGFEGDAPAFVGRALELAQVLGALPDTAAGSRGGVLLQAPAGMGKTAFCRRLAREARGLGWRVRAVQATEWTRPYGLATDLVEPLLREAGEGVRGTLGPHACAVLAAMTPAGGPQQPIALPIGRHQMVGAVRRLLLATAQDQPVLLIVDDAHAADDASAEVLAQLAAGGPPLFVLLACRPALPQVLDSHVRRMLRAGTLEAIELGPLNPDESALLAARSASSPLRPHAAEDIARLSEGVPFAVVELARAPRGANAARSGMPRSVSAAIADRLCDVGEDGMEVVRRLAIAADGFDVATAVALAADPGADAMSRLDQALAGAVLIVDGGRYRFRHALARPGTLAAYDAAAEVASPERQAFFIHAPCHSPANNGSTDGFTGQPKDGVIFKEGPSRFLDGKVAAGRMTHGDHAAPNSTKNTGKQRNPEMRQLPAASPLGLGADGLDVCHGKTPRGRVRQRAD